MKTAAAVLDLDGTIVTGTSVERLFLPWLLRRRVIGPRQLLAAGGRAATMPVRGRTVALRRNKRWLTGVRVGAVDRHVDGFVEAAVVPRMSVPVLDRLEDLSGRGYRPCILSGAPSFLAEAVGHRLGIDLVVATELEVRDGRFTGRISGPHHFGPAKRTALEALARREGIDLASSIGFADDESDETFLSCFGQAVAVSPDRGLNRIAQRRGWEVIRSPRTLRSSASDPPARGGPPPLPVPRARRPSRAPR